tara:strand:- start:8981 stop:9637 length:657 start_codon:yes stop_codon:yes gene_type:complete
MHTKLKLLLAGVLLCSAFISHAQAGQFFFEDQKERFTMTFPDTWARISNQKADDQITIAGPGANDYAICKVRVRQDRRYVIFPGKFDSDVQKVAYSRDFWNDYLGDYNEVVVDVFKDGSGLGLGYASMAEASYETAEGTLVRKRGVMFASLYHDHAYIVDCSSEESVYQKWRPAFLSIVKSVDFGNVRHAKSHGHYRGFDTDPKLEVEGPKALDVYKF